MRKFTLYAVIISATIVVVIALYFGLSNSCQIKQLNIIEDVKKYQKTMDAELCENINDKIANLDSGCETDIEILDCG